MWQDDGHHSLVFQEMKAVQQKGKISSRFGSQPVVFEAYVVGQGVGGFPAVAEGRVGDDGVERGFFSGIQLAQDVPVVG
ncbi:hypothetical protein D3C85_1751060 [compost metagenome]